MWLCPEIALHSSTRGPIFGTPNVPCKTWAKPPEMPCMKRGEPHFMPRMPGPIFRSDHCWRANVFCLPKLVARHHLVLPENGGQLQAVPGITPRVFRTGRLEIAPYNRGRAPRILGCMTAREARPAKMGRGPEIAPNDWGAPHTFGVDDSAGCVPSALLCP